MITMKDFNQRLEMLEKRIFINHGRLSYICSPLRGETPKETYHNMLAARYYMVRAAELPIDPAIAPHAYMPLILDDTIQAEREAGLEAGLMLLRRCKRLLVCGNRISKGMKNEILTAASLQIPIWTFRWDMSHWVAKLLAEVETGWVLENHVDHNGLSTPVEKITFSEG